MDVILTMCSLVLLFIGSHVGLTLRPVRSRLAAALGEWGFLALYFAVAAASFTAATVYYADHRLDGPPGLALGDVAALRPLLIFAAVAGVVAMVASFSSYPRSPYSLAGGSARREPRGFERVTRHPFFAGMALFATAHALLATHLIGTVLMLGLAALSIVGPWHQDRKLARLRGEGFTEYLRATSAVPFAAIAAGRQVLAWRELPLGALAAGLAIAVGLRGVHEEIFAHRGAAVVAVTVGGAAVIALVSWLRTRRTAPPAGTPRGRVGSDITGSSARSSAARSSAAR